MTIKVSQSEGVLELVLARPEKRNALNAAMYDALTEALQQARADEEVRVVVIRGEGGHFTAGNDLSDFVVGGSGAAAAKRFIDTLVRFDKPIVAIVEGNAVGIGTTMLLHCDLVYAAPGARFAVPFVDLGLVPEAGSSVLLPLRIGAQRAAEMLLLGEPLGAEAAAKAGLCTAIVEADMLLEYARGRARALAAKPPSALRATRRLTRTDDTALWAAMEREWTAFGAALEGDEAQAALAAFLAGRR